MAIGSRPTGVASGPSRPPRLVGDAALASAAPGEPAAAVAEGGVGLVVLDYGTDVFRGVEANGGFLAGGEGGTLRLKQAPVGQGRLMLIDRLVIQTTSSQPSTFRVYLGQPAPENIIEFSGSGDIDVADETQPLYVPGTSEVTYEWRGLSAAAAGIVRVQYRVAVVVGGGF